MKNDADKGRDLLKREPKGSQGLLDHGLVAATGALLVTAVMFGGWFASFALMEVIGHSLLVGMNYLVWPIIFPMMAFPVVFLFLIPVIRLFRPPYRQLLSQPKFHLGALLPIALLALALMLATCPLDIDGTFLTRGWEAFG